MSIITIYPTIPDVAAEDLLIISDISKEGNPTRTVSIGQLSGALSPPTGISLTTLTTTGSSTLVGNVLNIPIYQGAITLTTTGTSGVATLTGDTLNIPNYASGGSVATSLITGTVKLNSDAVQSTAANSITTTALRTYGVQFNGSGQMVVNVPWTSGGASGAVDSVTANLPLIAAPVSGIGDVVIGMQAANTTQDGYLTTGDWDTFNNKQDTITLTTIGTSGDATLTGATLNIPNYALGGGVTSLIGTLPITVSSSTGAVTVGVNTATVSTLGVSKLGSATVQTQAAVLASAIASRTYPIQHNSSDQMVVNVPWSAGGSTATSSALGVVKLFSNSLQGTAASSVTSTLNRTYGIQFNSSDQMVVNIPWTDTASSIATSTVLGISKLATDTVELKATNTITSNSNRIYGVQHNSSDQMVVNVPWTDTTYTLTTNNSSGPSTLINNVLNVPNYVPYEQIFLGLTIHDATLNPEIHPYYNTTGATFTVATSSTGLYIITASSGIFGATTKTHFSIMNPNVLAPLTGTGIMPMPTIVRVKTASTFSVDCYRANSGSDIGVATDLPTTGFEVTIEVRIYSISF